jgi:hypothetical protein
VFFLYNRPSPCYDLSVKFRAAFPLSQTGPNSPDAV